ncbi:amino acid adenylation domain-containing protein [Nodularia spumigena CS-586/05]|uniref:non-ribosomal peptide synthetase n=1 Tax=Nodularia spumigena TaxID=70799 RepID=UPI00232B6B17|nr:amino acid adenylation domain-containing protein [Nodularia spumigena]MDB9343170.1 amino acid adenylation domain-containing protein [Nodularia spumigena CS-588/06]MDB9369468.1 amino acid adenylation domain-containing protein [Nodularia spumigena CS-586/05]
MDKHIFSITEIEQSISKRFEHIVNQYPQQIAVKSNKKQLTYQELNQKANCIGRYIQHKCLGHEEPVAIFIDQGIDFIASMLAVLKIGKFYVPIDPTFPLMRNNYILEDSTAKVILTNSQNVALAEKIASKYHQIINIDDVNDYLDADNIRMLIKPDNLTYVLYTSGSTGKPKGVMHNQRNVLFNFRNQSEIMDISHEDQTTLCYSSSMISAARVIFYTLLNGASLHHFDIHQESVADIIQRLVSDRITIYRSVPSLFRSLVEQLPEQKNFPDLRLMCLTGDMVTKKDVEIYQKYFSDKCQFLTSLGSTETGTSRYFIFDKNTSIEKKVPLGYPVKGMKISLWDENHQEVGENEIGEIVVKSKYMALGYWRNPELSAKVFFKDNDTGEIIYHTGDLGQFNQDGCLFHCGRKDFQVKIRGNRVEIDEIEYYLREYNLIKEAIVTVAQDIQGEKYLAAYIIPKATNIILKSLKEFLRERLPEYMIPAAFVFLDAFPLTPNGKIARQALPQPDFTNNREEFIAPTHTTEIKLAQIWEEVLNINNIGIHDNFLDLGGNSLLATQVISRIRQTFRVEISLKSFLKIPTIAKIRQELEKLITFSTANHEEGEI